MFPGHSVAVFNHQNVVFYLTGTEFNGHTSIHLPVTFYSNCPSQQSSHGLHPSHDFCPSGSDEERTQCRDVQPPWQSCLQTHLSGPYPYCSGLAEIILETA